MNTVTVIDDLEQYDLPETIARNLTTGGILYYCDDCQAYHPDPDPDPETSIRDGEIVGLDGDLVAHFNADDGTVYTAELTLQDWLNDGSYMTEAEARRVGLSA